MRSRPRHALRAFERLRGVRVAALVLALATACSTTAAPPPAVSLRANDYGFIVGGPCELARFARERGVAVFFLTGRTERFRAATEANLKVAGYEWTAVLLKPNDLVVRSAAEFKAAERRKLTIRVLSRQERSEQGDREFGLNQPAVAATLFENDRPALAMAFGSTNPQKVLQY